MQLRSFYTTVAPMVFDRPSKSLSAKFVLMTRSLQRRASG